MGVDLGVLLAKPAVAEGRTIEAVTGEILALKKTAGDAILGIGQRLIEAKDMLSHGEWLPWLTEQVEFSERTAQNFMRLSREWSNPQTLADLGASKALTLLALPPEERDSFLTEPHPVDGGEKTVIDMSARELEKAIQERKAALEAKEAAEADKRAAEQARDKMAEDMRLASARLEALDQEATTQGNTVERLRAELEELRARPVDMTVSEVPDDSALEAARRAGAEEAAKTARQEAEEKLKAKLDKSAEAKRTAEERLKEAQEAMEALKARAEILERQAKVSGSKELAMASVCFEAAQENVNKVLGVMQKLALAGSAEEHDKLVEAMHALFSAMDSRVPQKLGVTA